MQACLTDMFAWGQSLPSQLTAVASALPPIADIAADDHQNVGGQQGRQKTPNGGERIIEIEKSGDHRDEDQHPKHLNLLH